MGFHSAFKGLRNWSVTIIRLDAIEQVASGILPEDANMSSSLCGTVFSEYKAMDKSTNLLTIPFFTADHSSYANSTATVHKFHHCCIYTEFAVSYASTEFRIHYKLGVLRALHKMLFSKVSVAASTILRKYIKKFNNMKAQAHPADKLCNDRIHWEIPTGRKPLL